MYFYMKADIISQMEYLKDSNFWGLITYIIYEENYEIWILFLCNSYNESNRNILFLCSKLFCLKAILSEKYLDKLTYNFIFYLDNFKIKSLLSYFRYVIYVQFI